jgi:Fe-S cluster assembly protein SufD
LNGITIIGEKQHVDHYTLVQLCKLVESHQDYKGIFSDRSTGVFNGKIYVEKRPKQTHSKNNILLSDKATINAKPQLEIFADDVKCSHGCTIGQLDESAMFYMRQRGIQKRSQSFINVRVLECHYRKHKIPELKKNHQNYR